MRQVIYPHVLCPAHGLWFIASGNQSRSIGHHFFSDYTHVFILLPLAARSPPPWSVGQITAIFTAALDSQTMHRFWKDPLVPARLKRLTSTRKSPTKDVFRPEDAADTCTSP